MWRRGMIAAGMSLVALLVVSEGAYADGYHDFVGFLMLLMLAMLVALVVWFCASVIVEAEVYRRVLKWPRGHASLHSLLANIAGVCVLVGLCGPAERLMRSADFPGWIPWRLVCLFVLAVAMTVIEIGVLMLLNMRFAPRRRLIGVVAGVNAATIGAALLVVVGGFGALEHASNRRDPRSEEARSRARAQEPVYQAFPPGTIRPPGLPAVRFSRRGVAQGSTGLLVLPRKWCVIWRTAWESGEPVPIHLTAIPTERRADDSRIEIKQARTEQGNTVGVSEIVSETGVFVIEVEADGKWWIQVLSY